ncbi:hypothetical protein [Clostridium sp.]|uniref:hypothetical protein n=1 Tax=Clostridium sp. TaxID=1506 RepID=UPI00260DD976|nr:hypothetical protein [Clostridium sp.]
MENDMLQALGNLLDEKLKPINDRLDKLEEGQARIENKLDGVIEQTADLTEFRTETKKGIESVQKDINKLTNVTKVNCFEIADLKAVK